MHCNSGYYYVTKDLTIWGLCGFRVGILQFCPVCSLWTSRAVGSAYKIVTTVTEKKIKTASQNQRLSFGEVRPARGIRATWVRKQVPSLTAGVQQAVDRRRWERSFGSRRQQVGNPEIPSSRLQFCCQYLRQVGTADGNANALGKFFCKAWAN